MRFSFGAGMPYTIIAFLVAAAMTATCFTVAPASEVASPVQNWTGFYVGGNVGYGLSNVGNDFAFVQPLGVGGNATLAGSDSNHVQGVIGGLQLGYNWQVNSYLFGIEADLQASSQKNSTVFNSAIVNFSGVTPGSNPTAIAYSNKLGLVSTLRGRVGFILDQWLIYGTGGLAVGTLGTNGVIAPTSTIFVANLPGAWDQTATKVGWTIGVGVENAIANHWSWKVEYLYFNMGNVTASAVLPATNCYSSPGGCFNASGPGLANISSKFTDNVVRVGLNYKLGN